MKCFIILMLMIPLNLFSNDYIETRCLNNKYWSIEIEQTEDLYIDNVIRGTQHTPRYYENSILFIIKKKYNWYWPSWNNRSHHNHFSQIMIYKEEDNGSDKGLLLNLKWKMGPTPCTKYEYKDGTVSLNRCGRYYVRCIVKDVYASASVVEEYNVMIQKIFVRQ